MPARTIRMPAASDASSSVATGSTSFVGSLSGLSPGGMSATGGSTSSHTKKTPISSEPITNSGSAIAASDPIEIAWSTGPPRVDGRERAQAQRERDHEERRHERQDQRVLDRVRDQVPDRRVLLPLREADRRVAEVAVDEAAEPGRVLREERPVEVQLLVELVHGLAAWRRGPARRSRRRRAASPCRRRSGATRRTAPRRRRGAAARRTRARARPRGFARSRLRHRCHLIAYGREPGVHEEVVAEHAAGVRLPAPSAWSTAPSTQSALVQFR